jgi:glycosyltransferase involved in cell wall biosynthesis
MYNREKLISRAIASCIYQDFTDYEIIIVDDASTDNSTQVVEKLKSDKITLICHDINKGVGPARNTGIEKAIGEWVICLDSDNELCPGTLSTIYKLANEVDESIQGLRFMCKFDDGSDSPDPPLKQEIWNYIDYLNSLETHYQKRNESQVVSRRRTFDKIRYPKDRSFELNYHLDFAKNFKVATFPILVRLYHQDAHNSFCFTFSKERALLLAPDIIDACSYTLVEHGEAMKAHCSKAYLQVLREGMTYSILISDRLRCISFAKRYFKISPTHLNVWAVLFIGLINSNFFLIIKSLKTYLLRIKLRYA